MIARLNWPDVPEPLDHAKPQAMRLGRPTLMNTRLLAFDTATEAMAIAVQSSAGVHSFDGPGGAVASARLIPEIHALLSRAGLQLHQLQAIAFGAGPGAFTGLRTACAVAQGLAFGAALPVLAVDSLLIVAEAARAPRPKHIRAAALSRCRWRWMHAWARSMPARTAGRATAGSACRRRHCTRWPH